MSFHDLQKERLSDTLQLSRSGSSPWAGGRAGWLLEGKSAHNLQFTFLSNSVPVTVTMPFFPPLHWYFTFLPEGYKGERMWN
jgi:hypothetical protein